MKSYLLKNVLFISVIISLLFITESFAQENTVDNYKMRFNFKTVKQPDNSRLLQVNFVGVNKKDRKDRIPIYGALIEFYNTLDGDEILLGNAKTDEAGIAQITLSDDQKYSIDEDGQINLLARFEGTDAIDDQEEELIVKNLFLEMKLEEIDSIKTVTINAFTTDSLGVDVPIEEADIFISVGGMLSNMKMEEGTIEDGTFEFEFPNDLPGDANGDLDVFAMIEDNDDFGNVIQKQSIDWGNFDEQVVIEKNQLWSEAAPIWMYVVLTILLVGVWTNYIYTIINIFKIRKEGKELLLEEK